MTPRLLVVGVVAVLTFSACSNGGGAADALPIEPILDGEIEIDLDPSGTAAIFRVATNIPVACAVVYGTDDTFGSLAVDNDMQGGAHEDHGPLLTGLTPDTEYRYVLQGSDAEGNFYRSDVRTFRSAPATELGFGPNLAPDGAVVGASSEFSESFAAANAIDGDLGTEWSTDGDGDDAWIEIDLGRVRSIGAIALRTRRMTDGTAIIDTFTVTIDGREIGPFEVGDDAAVLDEPTVGRLVRIDADVTTGGNTGATEIEIFGS